VPHDVRPLSPADISQACELSAAAGWNQTKDDWARVLALQPDLCVGIDWEERLAATGVAVCYGAAPHPLAWIGMVLTRPEFRGRGFARAIMEMLTGVLDLRRVECIRLDATDQGRPLYLKLGYVDETPIERWFLPAAEARGGGAVLPYRPELALDQLAFGADRSAVLQDLARGAAVSIAEGYAMARPGRVAAYFGPCVARNAAAARALLEWFLAGHAGQPVYWDILADNRAAVALAREYGFEPRRRLMRMRRGRPLQYRADLVYAAAGFEFG
jgi:RimJ/RimL family protein N-acetyltransferase